MSMARGEPPDNALVLHRSPTHLSDVLRLCRFRSLNIAMALRSI